MPTTAKSRNFVKGGKPAPTHLAMAARLAGRYKVTLWQEEDGWYGRCLELPNCMGDGKSPAAAIAATRKAIVAGLAADLADGWPAPPPARDGIRSEQVNIRVTPDERAILEANAARRGFKGLADYLRSIALTTSNTR